MKDSNYDFFSSFLGNNDAKPNNVESAGEGLVAGTSGMSSDPYEASVSAALSSMNINSEAEASVTASSDLDFESILEVEGFLENSVFDRSLVEDDETSCETSCESSSTLSPGSSNQGNLLRGIDNFNTLYGELCKYQLDWSGK